MRVLVTGAAGFLGSHVVELLVNSGYHVVAVDNLYSGTWENLVHLPRGQLVFVEADVSDWAMLWEKISHYMGPGDVEYIVHLAAIVNVMEVYENPRRALDVNVRGTLNILELARRLDVDRLVYASSVAVYGEPKYLPIDEDHPTDPANLYGETKLMGERLLWHYARDYGLHPVALRFFNIYGPRMRPGPYAGVVYKFITALLEKKQPVIYGDGNQTRDFVYVGDAAEAVARALRASYSGPVNIGTGTETSIRRLYKTICSIIGYCPKPRYEPPRPGDVRRSRASIKLAMEKLGWKPVTSLEEGLKKTIRYYTGRLER